MGNLTVWQLNEKKALLETEFLILDQQRKEGRFTTGMCMKLRQVERRIAEVKQELKGRTVNG